MINFINSNNWLAEFNNSNAAKVANTSKTANFTSAWFIGFGQSNANTFTGSNNTTSPTYDWFAGLNTNINTNTAYQTSDWLAGVNNFNTTKIAKINKTTQPATDWLAEFNKQNEKRIAGINQVPIITYDADGNMIKRFYDHNGNSTHDNYYDKNNKIKHYDTFNADGSIKTKVDRTNNADGSFKDSFKDANDKHTQDFYYDATGRKTQDSSFGTDGKKTQDNYYNKDEIISKSTIYNSDNSKVDTTYDSKGKKAQDNHYNKDGKLSKSTAYDTDGSKIDTLYDANGNKTQNDYYNKDGKLINTAVYRKGDGGYGAIDWNNDGKMDGYIANHGDFDNFFTKFGKYWQLPDLESIVNTLDNSDKDTDKRNSFVSNGIITAHKISGTQVGFNVTAKDMSKVPGFNYDYAVWDKEKDSYTVGTDKNKDGLLSSDEIKCIVENVGNKTCSPLTFDINGDGVKTSDKLIKYDIDGNGTEDLINDVADGTLCIRGGNSGKDLFGDNTDLDGDGKADGFANGFDALKALAIKEGLINGKNDMVLNSSDIKILEDKYQFSMKTSGYKSEAKSLGSLGITEINLGNTNDVKETYNFDGQNNRIMEQNGATFNINGTKRDYADIWHTIKG